MISITIESLYVGVVIMNIITDKLKLLNATDAMTADKLDNRPLFTIELVLAKSKIKKVKCGAVVVIKLNEIPELKWDDTKDPRALLDAQHEMNSMTQVMVGDPELFKEPDGKWIPFGIKRCLELFNYYKTNADLCIKAPQLKVRHKISREEILVLRENPRELFKTAFMIDTLLDGDFSYDPWRKLVRRGNIGAKI
tara:strand:- start:49 stop:633 length:585 start_codon:yes stop_codon:yes gene_type:complete